MKRFRFALFLAVLGVAFSLSSCLKKDFEGPPDTTGYDPNLKVSMAIAELKTKFPGYTAKAIDSDWVISGVVTSSDKAGNIYQQLFIDDSTGGITILVENSDMYARYPVGRKVYIKLKGLYYGWYGQYDQIGATSAVTQIPLSLERNYIVSADMGHKVPMAEFDGLTALRTVNRNMLGRLVKINNVEVVAADTNKTYAAPQVTTNINLEDCSGNKIVLRTSGYSNFYNAALPKGKGSIIALYTTFNSTPQLIIRDTTDVSFTAARCGSGPAPVVPLITIDSLRKMHPGSGSVTLGSIRIRGVVISDRTTNNMDGRNVIIQNGDRGIMVRFTATSTLNLNDSVEVDVSGEPLELYSNLLQVNGVTNARATVIGSKTIMPRTLTIAQIAGANFKLYESTLVKIMSATIGAGTYSGNKNLTDATDASGAFKLYTNSSATFASQTVPSGAKNITGIIGVFGTTKQIQIRNLSDVQ